MSTKTQIKEFILLSKMAKEKKYAQEYLSLLARRGDLGSIRIGKRWYTTPDWMNEFIERCEEKKILKERVSLEFETSQVSAENSSVDTQNVPLEKNIVFPNSLKDEKAESSEAISRKSEVEKQEAGDAMRSAVAAEDKMEKKLSAPREIKMARESHALGETEKSELLKDSSQEELKIKKSFLYSKTSEFAIRDNQDREAMPLSISDPIPPEEKKQVIPSEKIKTQSWEREEQSVRILASAPALEVQKENRGNETIIEIKLPKRNPENEYRDRIAQFRTSAPTRSFDGYAMRNEPVKIQNSVPRRTTADNAVKFKRNIFEKSERRTAPMRQMSHSKVQASPKKSIFRKKEGLAAPNFAEVETGSGSAFPFLRFALSGAVVVFFLALASALYFSGFGPGGKGIVAGVSSSVDSDSQSAGKGSQNFLGTHLADFDTMLKQNVMIAEMLVKAAVEKNTENTGSAESENTSN